MKALLIMSAFTLATGQARAATLDLDAAFTGAINHTYDTDIYGFSGVFNHLAMTAQAINAELSDYDQITVRAALSAGQVFCVDPHDAYSPTTMSFDWRWIRDTGSIPGGQTNYTTAVTFLDAAGTAPTQTADGTFIRNEGAQISFNNTFTVDNDPFYFSGIELTITGPFPTNSGTPLIVQSIYTNFYSSEIPSSPGDPGPFITIVPEPTSLALLGLGSLMIARRRRRKL